MSGGGPEHARDHASGGGGQVELTRLEGDRIDPVRFAHLDVFLELAGRSVHAVGMPRNDNVDISGEPAPNRRSCAIGCCTSPPGWSAADVNSGSRSTATGAGHTRSPRPSPGSAHCPSPRPESNRPTQRTQRTTRHPRPGDHPTPTRHATPTVAQPRAAGKRFVIRYVYPASQALGAAVCLSYRGFRRAGRHLRSPNPAWYTRPRSGTRCASICARWSRLRARLQAADPVREVDDSVRSAAF
jgi:hypothetical protein